MPVSNPGYLKGFYNTAQALGAKVISSDFTFEIEGWEQNYLLCKQAPWAQVSVGGEIEVPSVLGTASWQPQQARVNHQGQIALEETVAGSLTQRFTKERPRDSCGQSAMRTVLYSATTRTEIGKTGHRY